MGYRFSLESANTVANLTFGKVMSCYRDIYSSEKGYNEFMSFLDQFHENIYSNRTEHYIESIRQIQDILYSHAYGSLNHHMEQVKFENFVFEDVLDSLYKLSNIFGKCKVKSLLLPPMVGTNKYYDDHYMTSSETLHKITIMHPGDSCLILQPQEHPYIATIFDSFPNFDIALQQADLWPAVLFWSDARNCVFVPVKHEDDLLFLYKIIKYDKNPFLEIKRIAEERRKKDYYIFQLSDLHFGAKNVNVAEKRLKSLIKTQLSKIGFRNDISFVITGDAVDSPTQTTENAYNNFANYLKKYCGKGPIRILGNHDINNHGLAFFHGKQHIANIIGQYPKIQVFEEPKIILLLFNSNTNGTLAEGEIGIAQMAEMGNLLDRVQNLNEYLLIAVLHHHLLPIPKPEHYEYRWYEKIIPNDLLAASLRLIDADSFLEWLSKRNVKIVLHGHKHIPFVAEHNKIKIIGCGSSTGQIVHKEKGKTYMSYNLLKIGEKTITCTQYVEEIYGGGAENIRTDLIEL